MNWRLMAVNRLLKQDRFSLPGWVKPVLVILLVVLAAALAGGGDYQMISEGF